MTITETAVRAEPTGEMRVMLPRDAATLARYEGILPDPKGGDTKVIWNRNNPDEVAAARQTFDTLRSKGFQAFSVTPRGEQDTLIRTFDPQAEAIIMIPAFQGG